MERFKSALAFSKQKFKSHFVFICGASDILVFAFLNDACLSNMTDLIELDS